MGWLDSALAVAVAALLIGGFVPQLRSYRRLIWGGAAIALITALYPRPDNVLAADLFGAASAARVAAEVFGVIWWMLGAWLIKGLLAVILGRTLFPNDDLPHSRRLFADLIVVVVYVIAFLGIMDTVFKESISAVLATSGILAIVIGLALQSTLADVFSGVALNIDQPFRSGDWITIPGTVEGQVIEINWRATRVRTLTNAIVVIPNSVIAKAVVTSHRRLSDPYYGILEIGVDQSAAAPGRVVEALKEAAAVHAGAGSGGAPQAFATTFSDTIIVYQLWFAVDDFAHLPSIRSAVLDQVTTTLASKGIPIGGPVTDVRITAPKPRRLRTVPPEDH